MRRRTSAVATSVVAAFALSLATPVSGPPAALGAPSPDPSPTASIRAPGDEPTPEPTPEPTSRPTTEPTTEPAPVETATAPADPPPAEHAGPDRAPWPPTTGLPGEPRPVWPGLDRHESTISLRDGAPAVVNVLDYDPAGGRVTLRPSLGQGTLAGLETVPDTVGRLADDGAIAAINGGFWLNNPVGDPNGFFARDGVLVSEAQTQGAGPRGTYGRRADGVHLIDRLDTGLSVSSAEVDLNLSVRGLNRSPSQAPPYPDLESSAFLYTPAWGATVFAQPVQETSTALRAVVIDGIVPPAGGGVSSGVVRKVVATPGDVAIPDDGAVLVTMGGSAGLVANSELAAGHTLDLEVSLSPLGDDPADWAGLADGLAAGPLLVRDGELAPASGWSNEGFSPEVHSNVRAPRSAVGVTGDGRVLLVTVDGRQPGYSAGMTMAELAEYMLSLGAVQAMALDGGASSQLVTDGLLRNRPCCDRSLRPVASSLVLYREPYEFLRTRRLAGSGREATAATIARTLHPEGTDQVLLASARTFPDALAGGPLAAASGSALLLAGAEQLSEVTLQALEDLGPRHVILLGGTAAIGEEVEADLRRRGYDVSRVAGRTRTETAAQVAGPLAGSQRVFLAFAGGFADALSAAAPAGMLGAPILLSGSTSLPEATREALGRSEATEVLVVGGSAVIGEEVVAELEDMGMRVTRLAGPSRFATAAAVNAWAQATIPGLAPGGLVVASGGTFPDALAGGPLAAGLDQLLMLVPSWDVTADPDAQAYLAARSAAGLSQITLLGGAAALTDYQRLQLEELTRPAVP